MDIKVKTNLNMQKHLASLKFDHVQTPMTHSTAMQYIAVPTFIEWDGCVLLKQNESIDLSEHFASNSLLPDRTAFEAIYNHIHLNDLVDTSWNHNSILDMGTKVIEAWTTSLYASYSSNKKFTIVLSTDGEDVTLRFYTMRDTEPAWLVLSHLDDYIDGLMIVELN